jgi:hypothetical protein
MDAVTAPRPPKEIPPLPSAAIDKLAKGDRAFLERDYRTALFAYQDAVYLSPQDPIARVRLGRAYLALRYPAQAIAQAERALASDPANEDARRLIEDAQAAPRAPTVAPASPRAPAAAAPPSPATGSAAPRIFRLVPEPQPPASPAAAQVAPLAPAAVAGEAAIAAPVPAAREITPTGDAAGALGPAPASAGTGATARRLYREALDLLEQRDFEQAASRLTEAIAEDPRLAVAWSARASARFGVGRYREALDDYRQARELDASLATPLFGLAECYRALADAPRAAEMYRRYAESRAPDVREDLRAVASRRAQELR